MTRRPVQATPAAAIAANRYGLGARPGDLAAIAGDPRGWLRGQLAAPPPSLPQSGLRGSADILAEASRIRQEKDAQDQQRQIPRLYRPIYLREASSRLAFAASTDRPFLERLTQFWSNHFAVSVDKLAVLGVAGAFEREAIRPHVLGRFADLLLAVERHPAMLLYLDNATSVGPGSALAQRLARRRATASVGINENLGREILELHTLGVDGGYSQADVTAFARVLTGWSIGGGKGRLAGGEPGQFLFRPAMHEPGPQRVLGQSYAQPGVEQGEAVLRALARQPATARHLATKLACHFIADDPPPAAVKRISRAFLATDGDLPAVYAALVDAPEGWETPLAKFKTPADQVISVFRGLQLPVASGSEAQQRAALAAFELLGQRSWSPGSPAGWPDRAADWNGPSALLQRVEWADALGQRFGTLHDARQLAPQLLGATLAAGTRSAIARAASPGQALTLLLAAPEFLRR